MPTATQMGFAMSWRTTWVCKAQTVNGQPAVECLVSLTIFAYLTSSVPHFKHHEALKARSVEDFIRASSLIMSWPLKESLWHAFVIWSPTILLAIHLLGKGIPRKDKAILTLALSA